MTTLFTLDADCRRYADARSALADKVTTLNSEIESLKRQMLPDIKRLVARAAEHHSTLNSHLEEAPDLFKHPRTFILHGIKIGYQKGKGRIEFDDPAKVVARIEEQFGDLAPLYLITRKAPDLKVLAGMSAGDLKRLGCTLVATGDQVVIQYRHRGGQNRQRPPQRRDRRSRQRRNLNINMSLYSELFGTHLPNFLKRLVD